MASTRILRILRPQNSLRKCQNVAETFANVESRSLAVVPSRNISTVKPIQHRGKLLCQLKLKDLPSSHVSMATRFINTTSSLQAKDFYKILGVSNNATQKEIKKAYFQLAKKFHPDKNKGDKTASQKFTEVAEAYEVLGDEQRRREYDTLGATGYAAGAQGGGGAGPFAGFGQYSAHIDPEELFRKIFGDAGLKSDFFNEDMFRSSFRRTTDVVLDLTFSEACRGVNRNITVQVQDTCARCKGKKAEPGTRPVPCHHCGGTGMETINTGPFVMRSTCRRCRGHKVLVGTPCIVCQGKGEVLLNKTVTVPVPAGVEDGQTVRMQVGTEEIFVTFRVARSNSFRREGSDVHSDVEISFTQASLGGSIKIKGIYENINLAIPPGTQSHTRIRLDGKGIARMSSHGYGDHYVHIKIRVPRSLTSKQKTVLLAYAEEEGGIVGTVNGVSKTQDGASIVTEDKDGLVSQIRRMLHTPHQPPVAEKEEIIKKVAEKIEDKEDDTKRHRGGTGTGGG
ncbi:dnaJ homolog subfamily A member 3, mitochondrial-like [Saccoglossus kowalevskii]|uniref:DnaJ homolog subfamily A member 3, mitochondrial-like n=1 Tax=Saccoglossus kowalevskii TaxID=10224 RepID=A0ABM0H0C3_SACKO|nr:PREDICTED: dnaJ homolog subfamily A member 3, mitochondrial-like [Saccoglossus kowalevskii]